ncbi:MAG TPA: SWIM zinc finger domain-containing protein [bacterium]|jgi:uncharacterized Zn finger protein|nr:SWIM zinc finger domain-containing protein [bacterium]HNU75999.1 SWIM zinc finger domain-containing protein [Deltaproteobacteria bacterium]HOC89173.1 SWIM zinc finger domain-containing protein [bacterium]HOZ22177.1 SWIM zinc finger domain-containing protein [bacterium]
MHKKGHIDPKLQNLQLDEVETLDRETTGGKGLAYYESVLISRPTVFHNHLSGSVGNYVENFDVRITFHEHEIAGTCSCQRSRKICKHILALLYSWVNDAEEFLDVEEVLVTVRAMKKEELLGIVENIIRQNSGYADLFLKKPQLDWDEIEPVIGGE